MRLLSLFFSLIVILFSSCKKDFTAERPVNLNQEVNVSDFFQLSSESPQLLHRIAADIQQKNNATSFLPSFILENGYPSWDHVIIGDDVFSGAELISKKGNQYKVDASGSNRKVPFVFIPMIDKATKKVLSFTQCYILNDTTFKYVTINRKAILKKYPDNLLQLINKRTTLSLFAVFEKAINPKRPFHLPYPYNLNYGNAKFAKYESAANSVNGMDPSSAQLKLQSGAPNNGDVYYVQYDDVRIYYIYHAYTQPPKWTILHVAMMTQIPQSDPSGGGGDDPTSSYYTVFYPDPLPGLDYIGETTGSGGGSGSATSYPPGWVSQDPNASPFTPSIEGNQEPLETDYVPSTLTGNSAWNYIAIGLINNSFGLIEFAGIPCPSKEAWLQLASFTPSQGAIDKLNGIVQTIMLSNGFPGAGYIKYKDVASVQYLSSGFSATTNLDFYPVKINSLPIVNSQQLTPQQFLQYIRVNINNFVNTSISSFTPYNHYGVNDQALWNSSNPDKAIVSINISGNDGSVITSFDPQHPEKWIFSTIKDPYNGSHPVSGNREFGYMVDPAGGYIFYTRGVDRLADPIGTLLQSTTGIPFNSADNLWKSFQEGISTFVNQHSGSASVETRSQIFPDWDVLRAVLNRTAPISSIRTNTPCN